MFRFIHKMGREVTKASFVFLLLIQFQPGLYNFLDASKSDQDQDFVSDSPEKVSLSNGSNKSLVNIISIVKDINTLSIRNGQRENDHGSSASIGGYEIKSIYENVTSDSDQKKASEEISDKETVFETLVSMNSHDNVTKFDKKLMRLMGMSKISKKKSSPVPKYMTELYKNQRESNFPTGHLNLPGRFTRSANTVRSFYHAGNEKELPGFYTLLRFDISSIPENEIVTGAELRIPFDWDDYRQFDGEKIYLVLHDVVKLKKNQSNVKNNSQLEPHPPLIISDPITHPVDTKSLKLSPIKNSTNSTEPTFWLTFDVFPAISRLTSPTQKKNVRLALEIVFKNGTLIYETLPPKKYFKMNKPTTSKNNTSSPMLLTYSDDGLNPRKTRDPKTLSRHYRAARNRKKQRNHRHKNRRKDLCSRKKMFVDFGDVGWNDWITAPPGYQAFYCSGECPYPMADHLNATNHAVIQALAHSMNPGRVPPPCCAPNKYSSLMILYSDISGRATLRVYEKMIVESCGCS